MSIAVTKKCVEQELLDARVYRQLLFGWINGIVARKAFLERFDAIFKHVRSALVPKYILSITKLFGRTNEEGLWKLMIQVKEVPDEQFELRLERVQSFLHERLRESRKSFLLSVDSYVAKINDIRGATSPLRNTQIAHNFPKMPQGESITWDTTKEWIDFAEEVYVQSMDAICESPTALGRFVDEDLEGEIEDFNSFLDSISATSTNKD